MVPQVHREDLEMIRQFLADRVPIAQRAEQAVQNNQRLALTIASVMELHVKASSRFVFFDSIVQVSPDKSSETGADSTKVERPVNGVSGEYYPALLPGTKGLWLPPQSEFHCRNGADPGEEPERSRFKRPP